MLSTPKDTCQKDIPQRIQLEELKKQETKLQNRLVELTCLIGSCDVMDEVTTESHKEQKEAFKAKQKELLDEWYHLKEKIIIAESADPNDPSLDIKNLSCT